MFDHIEKKSKGKIAGLIIKKVDTQIEKGISMMMKMML